MTISKTNPIETVLSYKGFDANWQCRGYQYEVGKTYEHKGAVAACEGGFHACEYPLDVFGYYAPGESKYAMVEQSGDLDRHADDSKVACRKITIKAEIGIPALVKASVEYIISRCAPPAKDSPATNTGNQSAATNTGDWSAATNTGDWSAATNTGNQSAATNTGNQSAATNTGNQSAATVEGKASAAMASGYQGRVMGARGCALFLVERDTHYNIVAAWAGIVGKDGIKPGVFYMLKGGNPVEVTP